MSSDTNPDAVKLLSDDEVAEIEARANAATPRYCVDWEKGRHALLQDSDWRSACQEQPRTIATFDRDNGYLDLSFCAEARTDIPALCATVRALREMAYVPKILPDDDELTYQDEVGRLLRQNTALREQLAQARADVDKFSTLADERHDLLSAERRANDDLRSERARMLQSLERAQQARNAYQAELAQVTQERDRLQRGEFTSEEFQSLCHNTDIHAGFDAFADGCEAYQQKLSGRCRTKGKVL